MSGLLTDPSNDLAEILAGLEAFLAAEVKTRHERHFELLSNPHRIYHEDGRYRAEVLALIREVRMASAEAGYYLLVAPESLGGAELGYEAFYHVWETIFRSCGALQWLGWHGVAHWTKGPSPVFTHLTPAALERYLPDLASGRQTTCFALSEPDAGSDAWMMRTRAIQTADGWRLDGEKQWISNAAHADLAVVFAVTDPELVAQREGGVSAFLVPTDTPGFAVNSVIPMFGHPGSNEGIIQMADVDVPAENLIGAVGDGFKIGLAGVSLGRLYNSAKGVGLARWGLAQALDYIVERKTFGSPVSANQGVTFPLADSAMEVHAAHLMGLNCARLLDSGQPAVKEIAMSKAYSTEVGVRALDRVVQAHGAMGFTNELGLAEAWQQLRLVCVADGSSEILRRQIVGRLLKGDRAL